MFSTINFPESLSNPIVTVTTHVLSSYVIPLEIPLSVSSIKKLYVPGFLNVMSPK